MVYEHFQEESMGITEVQNRFTSKFEKEKKDFIF